MEKVFSFGTERAILRGQDNAILPAQLVNHSAGSHSCCLLVEVTIKWNPSFWNPLFFKLPKKLYRRLPHPPPFQVKHLFNARFL